MSRGDGKGKRRSRRGGGKQHHIDEYREVSLGRAGDDNLSEALMQLLEETRANSSRLLPEKAPVFQLPEEEGHDPADIQAQGTRAARSLRRMMEEGGIPLDTHYYTERERLETGEVNRTYDVDSSEKEGE